MAVGRKRCSGVSSLAASIDSARASRLAAAPDEARESRTSLPSFRRACRTQLFRGSHSGLR